MFSFAAHIGVILPGDGIVRKLQCKPALWRNRFFNKDGEMDIVKKIDRIRASTIAEKLGAMGKILAMAQKKLQEPVVQQKVLDSLNTADAVNEEVVNEEVLEAA